MGSRLVDRTRQDWDERAKENAFFYVATSLETLDEKSFFESGEKEYELSVEPVLRECGFDPAGKKMLEVGCGAGRMTRLFATRFARVVALDISSEMLKRGQGYLQGFKNIDWVLGDGSDLSAVEDQSVQFVFCYLVLQHLPTKALALHYMTEMLRTLQPGGLFLFQFNGNKLPTMNLKGRLTWRAIDILWSAGLRKASQSTASLLGLDSRMAGKSWRGAKLDATEVSQTLRAAGVSAVQMKGEGTNVVWCWGTKSEAKPISRYSG